MNENEIDIDDLDDLDETVEEPSISLGNNPPRQNYINNKEFLLEIHKSKLTYCSFTEEKYAYQDVIVASIDDITPELIEATRIRKAHVLSQAIKATLRSNGAKQTEIRDSVIDPQTIATEDIVFRVMTSAHIPLDPDRKRKGKGENANHTRTPFLPFKHFILVDGEFKEVLRSHWRGTILDGKFDMHRGTMTRRLAEMFMILVDRYSRRSNWRSYTYLDEMKSHALLQLSQIGLQFNEAVSDNPFAFYTTTIKNCLSGDTQILTKEYGSIAIDQVSGQDVHLLDGNGEWVECHVFDHGVQETFETKFSKGRHVVTVRSTGNHGWFSNGVRSFETSDFANNYQTKIDNLQPSKLVKNEESYRKGVIHGIIYGDGSKTPGYESRFFMRLCSNKISLASWLTEFRTTAPQSYEGDLVYHVDDAWCDLKSLPENPMADSDYLLGFIRGWLATDGCVATKNNVVSICGDVHEASWLRTWAPCVGFQIGKFHPLAKSTNYGERKKESGNIHLFKHNVSRDDLLNQRHADRWVDSTHDQKWSTYQRNFDPSKVRKERVYCPIVRTTGSFALTSGIHSANCFTRILNLEKKNQNIRDDVLIMHGASPSYTRQNDYEYARAIKREIAEGYIPAPKVAEDSVDKITEDSEE